MPTDEKFIHHLGGQDIDARYDYKCGHCGREVTGRVLSIYAQKKEDPSVRFLLCPSCIKGSV